MKLKNSLRVKIGIQGEFSKISAKNIYETKKRIKENMIEINKNYEKKQAQSYINSRKILSYR